MRILTTLALALFALPALASDWEEIALGTTADLLGLNSSFAGVYVVGRGGFAALSDFTRTVWTPVNTGTASDLISVHQPSSGQVWVGASGGDVQILISGTWESRDIPSGQNFRLRSRSSGATWAIGSGGSIYSTLNLGQDWALKHTAAVQLHDGSGFVNSLAYFVGDDGTFLRTTNGVDFIAKDTGTSADLYGAGDGPANWPYAVGAGGTIIRSTDGELTFDLLFSGTTQNLRAFSTSAQNANWMLAAGDDGTLLKSTDAGDSWCSLDTGSSADFNAVAMLTNSEYLVAGDGGVLLRTTTGGGTCTFVAADNCLGIDNPDQRDTDNDGFGNLCDADLDNDCDTDFDDLALLKAVFFSADPDADFNGDGSVDFVDLQHMKTLFFNPPGPSNLPNGCP